MDAHECRKQLGLKVQQLRDERGLSQRALAEMVGTNQPYLCRIENGEINLGINLISRISAALDTSLSDLFDF